MIEVWPSLKEWLLEQGLGNTQDPQVIMLDNTQYDEFRQWVKDNQTSYRLVNMRDAPRDGVPKVYRQTPPNAMAENWLWRQFLTHHRLFYIPDHTQFIFARMYWSG